MTQSAISDQYTAAKYYSISSDSTHIHGTHVPVKELSTASIADIRQVRRMDANVELPG
jgi:hypothetical protein